MNEAAPIVALLCLALFFVTGCGNDALRINAEIARAMLEVQSTSGPTIRELRINASVDSARNIHDTGGTETEAQNAALHTASEWQCAIDGHGIYSSAVSSYIGTIGLWQAGEDFQLSALLPFVGRVVDSYRFLSSCLRSLGSSVLPEVPEFFNLIPSAWSVQGE